MQRIDELIDEVVRRAKRLGYRPPGLAVRAGLHPNTLRGIYQDGWSPTRTTLKQLQVAIELLEKELEELTYEEICDLALVYKIHPPKIPGQKRPPKKRTNTTATPISTAQCA